MKAAYYLGGLTLGVIVGVGVGYMIGSDFRKRAKIQRFFNDVGDKIRCVCGCDCDCGC